MVLHGVILKGSEAALPQGLARAPGDFQNHFLWVVLGEAIMVFIFTMIYALGFAAGGFGAGVGLGVMFGIIYAGANLNTPSPGQSLGRFTKQAQRRPYNAMVIRVYDAAGNVIETHEHEGEFKER